VRQGLVFCGVERRLTRPFLRWMASMGVAAALLLALAGAAQASPLYPSCPVPGQDLAWFSWEFDPYCLCFKRVPSAAVPTSKKKRWSRTEVKVSSAGAIEGVLMG